MSIVLKLKMREKVHQFINDLKTFFTIECLFGIKNCSKIMMRLNIKFICSKFMFDLYLIFESI
jgi:hypothetical protein